MATNVNSYDIAQKPFTHDPTRGKWEKSGDFAIACIGHAFRVKNFCILVTFVEEFSGVTCMLPALLLAGLFMLPIIFIQSFLGQFSSTGFISAFRVSPLFKGIGFVILFLNFTSIIYSSSTATVPILYLLHSFGSGSSWTHCDNEWNTPNCTEMTNNNETRYTPLWEYFQNHVVAVGDIDNGVFGISWSMCLVSVFLWIGLAAILLQPIQLLGKLLRYSTIISIGLLTILMLRVTFSLGWSGIFIGQNFPEFTVYSVWLACLLAANMMLGGGWGVTMTLASFNHFHEDIEKFSGAISLGMTGVVMLASTLTHYVDKFVEEKAGMSSLYFRKHTGDFAYLGFPMFAAELEATHMWCFLFYLILVISEINSILIQTISVLTAIFDEYSSKRSQKRECTIIMCVILFTFSLLFNNTYGFYSYSQLDGAAFSIQLFICFLELIMLVWIYGRERFIRDISFMLGKPFKTWKFNTLRYIYPLPILIMAYGLLEHPYHLFMLTSSSLKVLIKIMQNIPFVAIPCFMVFRLWKITGTPLERLKKSMRPIDWYPSDAIEKDKYDLLVTSSDVSQRLMEMNNLEAEA